MKQMVESEWKREARHLRDPKGRCLEGAEFLGLVDPASMRGALDDFLIEFSWQPLTPFLSAVLSALDDVCIILVAS